VLQNTVWACCTCGPKWLLNYDWAPWEATHVIKILKHFCNSPVKSNFLLNALQIFRIICLLTKQTLSKTHQSPSPFHNPLSALINFCIFVLYCCMRCSLSIIAEYSYISYLENGKRSFLPGCSCNISIIPMLRCTATGNELNTELMVVKSSIKCCRSHPRGS